jgi:hypothetical protein
MAEYRPPAIPYLRLRATFRASGLARLPPFKGSTLRGAFGHALRKAVCAMGPAQPCETCTLRGPCVYTRLFETFVDGSPPPFLKGLATAPRPYVFEPRSDAQDFAPGDPLEADLVLLGQATELQAYALLALERMGEPGFGKGRHPFRLERVRYLDPEGRWRSGFEAGAGEPARRWPGSVPATLPPAPPEPAPERLTLRFATPTRIVAGGRPRGHLSFRQLAFPMLRRVLEIAHFHVPGATVDWDFQPLLRQADDVRVARDDLRWTELSRYSSRQKATHPLDGFVGELDLEGPLAPFLPLLRAAEIVHVGKGATFGLGKVEVAPA